MLAFSIRPILTECFFLLQVSRIIDLLDFELELEVEREENLVRLIESLDEMITDKEIDIASKRKVAEDMEDVRLQLNDGMIAENLDQLIELKLALLAIEQELVEDLSVCLLDLKELLEDARDRASRTRQALNVLSEPPETRSSEPFDWTDIEEVEVVLQAAAENVAGEKERIRDLSQRIDDALINRAVVLGEDVPPGLAKNAQRSAARSIQRALSLPEIDFSLDGLKELKERGFRGTPQSKLSLDWDFDEIMDLKERDEKELLSLFVKSVGSATVDSSKAAFHGLKAIFGTMGGGSSKARTRRDQDGSAFLKDAGETDSGLAAGKELKKTGSDLLTSAEAVAALGAKFYDKTIGKKNRRGPY